MRISDWSSDVCSSDLRQLRARADQARASLVASRRALADRRAQLRQLEVRKRVASRALTSNANLEADRAIALGEKARDIVDFMDLLSVSENDIGRASGRERVCQYVYVSGGAVTIKKKTQLTR